MGNTFYGNIKQLEENIYPYLKTVGKLLRSNILIEDAS